jgi:hypothetical protein
MSIPYYDVNMLWRFNPDEFNEWRLKNDLPMLFAFFKDKLPSFQDWLDEFEIDIDTCCRVIPSGKLFVGSGSRLLIQNRIEQKLHWSYSVSDIPQDKLVKNYKILGDPIPEIRTFIPYFYWAKKKFKEKNFIFRDSTDRTDTFVYNSWSAPGVAQYSRASLFRTFQVLKMGGITLHDNVIVSRRNLDFTDLDSLTVDGKWHGSSFTYIHFSSCRDIVVRDAELAFYKFVNCYIDKLSFIDCKIYDFHFDQCALYESRFVRCKMSEIVFDRCSVSVEFEKCDLSEVKYLPKKGALPADILMYRRLRTAYQNVGKRHEAAKCYYLERKAERKAMFSPLLYLFVEFPRISYPGPVKSIINLWKQGHVTKADVIRHILSKLFFHAKTWIKYKTRYMLSLIEELIWGYGERPIRILLSSVFALLVYGYIYYKLFNYHCTTQTYSLTDCIYFSVVTFTTLGYGDITPKTDMQKIICGSEALLGALFLGLIVAGFANKGRY